MKFPEFIKADGLHEFELTVSVGAGAPAACVTEIVFEGAVPAVTVTVALRLDVLVLAATVSVSVVPDLVHVSQVWLLLAFQLDWFVVIVMLAEADDAAGLHEEELTDNVGVGAVVVNGTDGEYPFSLFTLVANAR